MWLLNKHCLFQQLPAKTGHQHIEGHTSTESTNRQHPKRNLFQCHSKASWEQARHRAMSAERRVYPIEADSTSSRRTDLGWLIGTWPLTSHARTIRPQRPPNCKILRDNVALRKHIFTIRLDWRMKRNSPDYMCPLKTCRQSQSNWSAWLTATLHCPFNLDTLDN